MPITGSLFQQLNYSKFIPPKTHPLYFARKRLNKRLDQASRNKYTLLHAPEGYGKTSLLSDWCQTIAHEEGKRERKALWYRIDENDREPEFFWGNLTELMDSCWPGIKTAVIDSMRLLEQSLTKQMVLTLANHIARFSNDQVQYTIVFDDFQCFGLSESEAQLLIFVDMLPSNVNIIISSKEYLSNRLIERDAYSKLSLVGVSELSMTESEIRELLACNGQDEASDGLIRLLYQKSEGWPLALYLILEQSQQGTGLEAAVSTFSGNDRFLSDAVFKRVTCDLPQKAMLFLLETSFFESFSIQMCNSLFGNEDAQAIVDHLERVGAFTFHIDGSPSWYRYHYLFGEWLCSQAMSLHFDQIMVLNQKAGSWYRNNKRKLLAAKHIVAATEGDFILGLAQCVFYRSRLKKAELMPWLFSLREDDLEAIPFFCLLASWAYTFCGRPNDARFWLEKALSLVKEGDANSAGLSLQNPYRRNDTREVDNAGLRDRMALTARVIDAKCSILAGDLDRGKTAAKQLLGEMDPLLDDILKMVLYQVIGEASELSGDLDTAGKSYRKAMTLARVNRFDFLVAYSRYQLVHLSYLQGRLSEAEKLCRVALAECPPGFTIYGALCAILGMVELTKGRLDELDTLLEKAFLRVSPDRNIDIYLEACMIRALYCSTRRNYSEALLQFAAARQAIVAHRDVPPRGVAPIVYAHLARLYIRLKDYESAEDALREYDSLGFPRTKEGYLRRSSADCYLLVEESGGKDTLEQLGSLANEAYERKFALQSIELNLLIMRQHYYLENNTEAIRFLKKALELSKREQIMSPFVEEGDIVRLLLVELIGAHALGYDLEKFVRRLIAFFDSLASEASEAAVPTQWASDSTQDDLLFVDHWGLTKREVEVLRMLMRGMNRKEIATEMCNSQNTVKTHISHIYEKLGVHSVSELLRKMVEFEG